MGPPSQVRKYVRPAIHRPSGRSRSTKVGGDLDARDPNGGAAPFAIDHAGIAHQPLDALSADPNAVGARSGAVFLV